MLTKEQLLKPKTKELPIGDGVILVKALPARFILELKGKELVDEDFYRIISASVIDETGQTMLTADDAAGMDFFIMNQLVIGIMEFNSLAAEAVRAAKEALKKAQTDGSVTS